MSEVSWKSNIKLNDITEEPFCGSTCSHHLCSCLQGQHLILTSSHVVNCWLMYCELPTFKGFPEKRQQM